MQVGGGELGRLVHHEAVADLHRHVRLASAQEHFSVGHTLQLDVGAPAAHSQRAALAGRLRRQRSHPAAVGAGRCVRAGASVTASWRQHDANRGARAGLAEELRPERRALQDHPRRERGSEQRRRAAAPRCRLQQHGDGDQKEHRASALRAACTAWLPLECAAVGIGSAGWEQDWCM